MKKAFLFILTLFLSFPYALFSQSPENPPAVRMMAEWEETEYLVVSWAREFETLREIVRHGKEEAKILIVCRDSTFVQDFLQEGGVDLANISYFHAPFNSIWTRDYAGVSAYQEEVGELQLVDWIYNRPRPHDDRMPERLSSKLEIGRLDMEKYPNDLVHIGGNFITDGRGVALSTRLFLDENGGLSRFAHNFKSPKDIQKLVEERMGIYQYLTLPKLPFDPIHHLDMHLKFLNEETILLGQYPEGIADGDQIEANLKYLLEHFPTASGQAWKIVRIPMPADGSYYPDSPGAWYQTYTNSVFVNKMLLVPQYDSPMDSVALEILREALPGYKVIGINSIQLIKSAGALHCVTANIGVREPLLIQHSPMEDQTFAKRDHYLEARIKHQSGIEYASLYYKTEEEQLFKEVPMISSSKDPDTWFAYIPYQEKGSSIRYFFQARAFSGKEIVRPLPAPEAYFEFQVKAAKGNLPR